MASKYKVVGFAKLKGGPMDVERAELTKYNIDAEVVEARVTKEDELIAVAKDADAIMGGGPLFSRRVMEALPKCRMVVTYSVGYDGIDVDAATDNGIIIVNNPATYWCVEEVSNQAITLLLACAKKLVLQNDLTKQGRWMDAKRSLPPMGSIYGQTLGLVGCGAIGRMTARKAQCFGLKVRGYDPYLDESSVRDYNITLVSLPKLLKESDYISVHTPLSEETWHLIGEKEFKQMKPTAYIVNTSRGNVIDELALIKALQEKRFAGAGLDVFEKEPVDLQNPLLKMDNVIVIPHSASYSDRALDMQPINPTHEVARVLSGQWPKNVINRNVKPKVNLVRGD
jgi:D-3-phosphoglycerate dehydrogenase